MTDYTTIRVTEDAKDDAEDSKRDDETWNDYLRRCTENPPETREFVPAADATGPNPDELAEAVVDLLVTELGDGLTLDGVGDIDGSLSTIEERTGRIERTLEDLQR